MRIVAGNGISGNPEEKWVGKAEYINCRKDKYLKCH